MITCRTKTSLLLIATVVFGPAGCRSTTGQPNHTDLQTRPRVQLARQIITGSEIANTRSARTAYDLVERLRPEFLKSDRSRDISGAQLQPAVYLNGLFAGGVSVLSEVSAGVVAEIRFVPAHESFTRHGEKYGGGDIMIYLRR